MRIHLLIPTLISAIVRFTMAAPSSSSSSSAVVIIRPSELPESTIEFPAFDIPGLDYAILGIDYDGTAGASQPYAPPTFEVHPSTTVKGAYDVYVSTGNGKNPGEKEVEWINGKVWAGQVVCETSNASPTFTEIDDLRYKLLKRPPWCVQRNGGGSQCTRLESSKGGDVSLCGSPSRAVECAAISWGLMWIKLMCPNNEFNRAGGMYKFLIKKHKLRVALH
ncbi:hypothetical protein BZA05DRAFT_454322 [Tricharina praecox]|uniref:uncharacterized protein n=1 Tax=Tricharina praecox TaxID=43433 RepID=UPI00221F4F58|nr:uncharacterized protein BZA05DRAFT_454322 [Tricharina praecox]KAI5850054.1 hypothetical protein BZA05DRAFT_454322 [Tricharina praecox]